MNEPTIEEQIARQRSISRGVGDFNDAILASLERLRDIDKRLDSQQKLGKCKICNGNDFDIPCAYTTEKPNGCLRAARLDAQTVPVEPEKLKRVREVIKNYAAKGVNHADADIVEYIDSLQSALQRVTEERDAEIECRNAAARAYEAAESRNRRMVELLKEPSEGMIESVFSVSLPSYEGQELHMAYDIVSKADCRAIFKAMSAELLKEAGK